MRRNRGELAEGWYDPATLERARKNAMEYQATAPDQGRAPPEYAQGGDVRGSPTAADGEDDDDDDYGPTLPHPDLARGAVHSGPTIPNMQDIELKRGKMIS